MVPTTFNYTSSRAIQHGGIFLEQRAQSAVRFIKMRILREHTIGDFPGFPQERGVRQEIDKAQIG